MSPHCSKRSDSAVGSADALEAVSWTSECQGRLQRCLVETLSQSGHRHQITQTTEPDETKTDIRAAHTAFSGCDACASGSGRRGGAARLTDP